MNAPHTDRPLILTLELAADEQQWAQQQRTRYFPPERNFIPAHVTLFHALPARHEKEITDFMQRGHHAPLVQVESPFLLGRGVAYQLLCPEVARLRDTLKQHMPDANLTAQDRAPWRPHLTVQNKVSPPQARELLTQLLLEPPRKAHHASALILWRYLGGPWDEMTRKPFISPPETTP